MVWSYIGELVLNMLVLVGALSEAKGMMNKTELAEYKITPKGMLQISTKQDIPVKVLSIIFKETLG